MNSGAISKRYCSTDDSGSAQSSWGSEERPSPTLMVARLLPNFLDGGGEFGKSLPCRIGRLMLPPKSLCRARMRGQGRLDTARELKGSEDAPPPGKEVGEALGREVERVVAGWRAVLSRAVAIGGGDDRHREVDVVGPEAVVRVESVLSGKSTGRVSRGSEQDAPANGKDDTPSRCPQTAPAPRACAGRPPSAAGSRRCGTGAGGSGPSTTGSRPRCTCAPARSPSRPGRRW